MLQEFSPGSADYAERVRAIFTAAPFVQDLGIELTDLGPGWCESELQIADRHLQQNGLLHGGVTATMADHTAGASAGSLMPADHYPLTVEFKVNLLRPGAGSRAWCRAEVLKAGRTLMIIESKVYCGDGDSGKLIASATVTIAVVSP